MRVLAFILLFLFSAIQLTNSFLLRGISSRLSRASSLFESPLLTSFAHDGPLEQRLLHYLNRNDTETQIAVEGYVLSKRSLGKQLVFVDLQIASPHSSTPDLCQALLKQDYFLMNHNLQSNTTTANAKYFEGYRRSLLPGTRVRVTGTAAPTKNPGNVVLLLQSIQLLQLPKQPQHIQTILQQCRKQNLPSPDVADACHLSQSVLEQRLNGITQQLESDPLGTKALILLQELSEEVFLRLPKNPITGGILNNQHTTMSRNKGNPFALPMAPEEWQQVPARMQISNDEQPQTDNSSEFITSNHVSFTGWVQNRQRFQDNITVVTLIMKSTSDTEDQRATCLIHPDHLQSQDAGLYRNLLAVRAQVRVQGYFVPTKKNSNTNSTNDSEFSPITLWAQQIRLLQSSDRPETVRYLLELIANQQFDIEEAAQALRLSYQEAMAMTHPSFDATQRQWKANQLAAKLQREASRSQPDTSLLRPLEKYRPLAEKYPVQFIGSIEPSRSTFLHNNMSLRTGVAGSRWMSQKKPQLEWMCQQIRTVLESHPDYNKRKLTILDIGGGQGFLANALGQAMMDRIEQIHVVDICSRAVYNGAVRAHRLGTPVVFEIADASMTRVEKADVVVALHACGHLSDVALAHAVHRQAGFVIVPCCFNSNPHLNIRGESVEDWLDISLDDWSALKKLAEVQGDIRLATSAMETICAVRAEAVQSKWKNNDLKVSIRQFPMEYSTRNTVMVGSFVSCF